MFRSDYLLRSLALESSEITDRGNACLTESSEALLLSRVKRDQHQL